MTQSSTSLVAICALLLLGFALVWFLRWYPSLPEELWKKVQVEFPERPLQNDSQKFPGVEFTIFRPTYFSSARRIRWGWFDAFLDAEHLHFCFGRAPKSYRSLGYISIPLSQIQAPIYDGESTCWVGESRQEIGIDGPELISALRKRTQH